MAFVTGATDCDYDVFISYRRNDNGFDWVSRLHQILLKQFHRKAKPGEDGEEWNYSIFRDDPEIDGNDSLPEKVREAVESSAILLVVMSHKYATGESKWCTEERNLFLKSAKKSNRTGCVFVVRMTDISEKFWPTALCDYKGYQFWESNPVGATEEISLAYQHAGKPPSVCLQLANDIWNRLNGFFPQHSRWKGNRRGEFEDNQCRFERHLGSKLWQETNSDDTFLFEQFERIRNTVGLFDSSRRYGVRLYPDHYEVRDGAGPFETHGLGAWVPHGEQ